MSYHTIIFAPDTLDPTEGPMIEMPGHGLPSGGFQSTLPPQESEPVLFDSRGNGVYFTNPIPTRRRIGFRTDGQRST